MVPRPRALISGGIHARLPEHGAGPGSNARRFLSKDHTVGNDEKVAEEEEEEEEAPKVVRRPQPLHISQNRRKAQRQSQPALILKAMDVSSRELYTHTPMGTLDLSYTSPRRFGIHGTPKRSHIVSPADTIATQEETPISLHSILSRYIETLTLSPWAGLDLLTKQELAFLKSKGYGPKSVERWAACLVTPEPLIATEIFGPGDPMPPFFLVLLFLRRKHMMTLPFGIVLRHVQLRLQLEHINWNSLKILLIRMVRHARHIWPESIPWIASVFTSEATRIFDSSSENGGMSAKILSDVSHFCNTFLSLLSVPASLNPMLSALHQEKAQFQVLYLMASRTPALIVTRTGFRAVMRTQLALKKTPREQEWAKLKRKSWPPWKESRNAMDEEKGYIHGSSRASHILHRMHEAGYPGRLVEKVVEIYAGWDTDLSPTIQTRTSLPQMSTQHRGQTRLEGWLWAARMRTTRTRREAWACFLAYEASGAPVTQEAYSAIFEKLHYPEIQESDLDSSRSDTMLLPGDCKEVVPEPNSPLNLVYLREPIPSSEQLYHRMVGNDIRPSKKVLAFLLHTSEDFYTILQLLELAKDDFGGGIRRLIEGSYTVEPEKQQLPGYMVTAIIDVLCKFGRFSRKISHIPNIRSPRHHEASFKTDRHYLLEYAHALLLHCRPHYRPAWTKFMQKVIFERTEVKTHRKHNISAQYKIIVDLVNKISEEHLDLDYEQLGLVCQSTTFAAQNALQGDMSVEDTQHVFTTGARQLRILFHALVNANLDTRLSSSTENINLVPPHIPAPAVLHVYVRALGIFRDYEGLYSFGTWAASHHVEVMARTNAQKSGPQALFNTIVALRAGLEGRLRDGQEAASRDLIELVRTQIESVEEWEWPSDEDLERYKQGSLTRHGSSA